MSTTAATADDLKRQLLAADTYEKRAAAIDAVWDAQNEGMPLHRAEELLDWAENVAWRGAGR